MTETILLVDDDPDNRTIYRTILEHSGFGVIEAITGEAAVEQARDHHPHLILMDVGLPVMDGWAATAILKGDPATASIPVVALTAHALAEHRQRAQEVGCDGYLAKPIEPREVLDEVKRLLS